MVKPEPSVLFKLLQMFGPLALGIIGAWGSTQYLSGAREQRLAALETKISDIQKSQDKMLTRDEMKLFIDTATNDLSVIRTDIRELRFQRR